MLFDLHVVDFLAAVVADDFTLFAKDVFAPLAAVRALLDSEIRFRFRFRF